MSEFEQALNAILSDPGEMEKISRLASELMGSAGGAPPTPDPESASDDAALLRRLTGLLGSAAGGGHSDKLGLVKALGPYLKPERRTRLEKALRLAQMARLATAALEQLGGEGDV